MPVQITADEIALAVQLAKSLLALFSGEVSAAELEQRIANGIQTGEDWLKDHTPTT
jgi:hypothetical protein